MLAKSEVQNISRIIYDEAYKLFGNKLVDVILYGSYARGDHDVESDMDFMILADVTSEDHSKYRKTIHELAGKLSLETDVTVSIKLKDSNLVYHYKDSIPYYFSVLNEGVSASDIL